MGDVIKVAVEIASFDSILCNLVQMCVGIFTPMVTKNEEFLRKEYVNFIGRLLNLIPL